MAKQLRMVRPNLEGLPELEIPEGYEIRTYQEGDDVHWADIINASFGGTRTAEDLHQDIVRRKGFDPEGLYFATYQGTPVGTTCARILVPGETEMGSVHMVAAIPEHTARKLGKCVSLYALHYFQQREFKCAILGTDDLRLAAIKTYLNLGLVPVYIDNDQPDRWRKIFSKLGLPVIPDQSEQIRATCSEELWAKICG